MRSFGVDIFQNPLRRSRSSYTRISSSIFQPAQMGSKRVPTFDTLAREETFRNPPKDGPSAPILNEFVTPHIESFNALFDDSGLHPGDGDGCGLLSLAIQDIGERVVFDGNGKVGSESGPRGWGNRMSSESVLRVPREMFIKHFFQVWIESFTIARPMVPEQDKLATIRKVFPSEVRLSTELWESVQ